MIAWSPAAEKQLRRRIQFTNFGVWLCVAEMAITFVASLRVPNHRWLLLAVFLLTIAMLYFLGQKLLTLLGKLGWEETVARGVRIAGSGMLANKPRDTSRLTRWHRIGWLPEALRRFNGAPPAIRNFMCDCGRIHETAKMRWIPNVLECVDELDDAPAVAVDPEGGRWVLICECGVGHYMLKESSDAVRN